ncbi:phage head closure protein [Lysobacter enzymogenes]|uniref:phage head closure protein n=1 Tax=Lysobacter enzymogenes TaxID=69 RepID=UPI0008966DA4|nr:phage head closure protein [Lysobacter enzymogenes]SDW94934.1 phage head-tail adaptor, putative, SPP1 family [Lysobacter enzymogenes]
MSTLAPRLRHAITFDEQVVSRDANGVQVVAWVVATLPTGEPLVDVPAEVLTGPGREFLQSGQMQSDVAARITCRWFPGGIKASWRVRWDGRVFNIKADPDTDATGRREYRFVVVAGVNDGQ